MLNAANWSSSLQNPGEMILLTAAVMLLGFVGLAAIIDARTRRVPNRLVIAGAFIGALFQIFAPGGAGWTSALAGIAVGMGIFLPLYALRAMGAGDVKLMGMVGAYLGPMGAFTAAVYVCVAGGVLALAMALLKGQLGRLCWNLRTMLTGSILGAVIGGRMEVVAPAASIGKLPYAVAIALGTFAYVLLACAGVQLL
jgi:prepilin peptidase CpaA